MDANKIGDHGGNLSYSKAGLAQSANCAAGNFKSTAAVSYTVDGVYNSLAIQDNIVFSSGHTNLVNNQICVFAVWVNNNTITTTQGPIVDSTKVASTGGTTVVPYPNVISGNALVGLIKVKAGVACTFTPGTTNFNATNVTTTFMDTACMPATPLLS